MRMFAHRRAISSLITAVLLFAIPSVSRAQMEVEVDPIAFALNGYSGHLGYRFGNVRADVGVFAADVPEAFHGNKGWTSKTHGVGAKLDWLQTSGRGLFAGVEGDYGVTKYSLTSTGGSVSRDGIAMGVRGGYRFLIGPRLYLVPWLGVDYNLKSTGATIAGQKFDESRVRLFPTVHAGWRF